MINTALPEEIKRLKAIADTGLLYAKNEFDKARYEELREMSLRPVHKLSGERIADLKGLFRPANEYPTAGICYSRIDTIS